MEKTSVRNDFYERQHRKNIKAFVELGKRIAQGLFKIVSIQIDNPDFGHRRVIIFLHEEEE